MAEVVFVPEVVVSEKALARKERFRKNKEEQGLRNRSTALSAVTKIYFDAQGEIVCVTKDPDFEIDPTWITYDFTDHEKNKLKNKPGSEFIVVSKEVDNKKIYTIEQRKADTERSVTHHTDYLEVPWAPVWEKELTQMTISLTKDKVILQILPPGLGHLKHYKHSDYQIMNQKFLSVYITVRKNPHYMAYDFKVPLKDFLSGKPVEHQIDPQYDYTSYSIYTKPLFDYCARV